MSPHTRQAIKNYLEGFIEGVIDAFVTQDLDPRELRPPRTVSVHGDLKPFHEAVLPHGILSITEFERSFSSRLGTTFEESARLIGAETFPEVQRQYRVVGRLSSEAAAQIEAIVSGATASYLAGGFPAAVALVVQATGGDQIEAVEIADLRVADEAGNESFFEIKSPKPNKGQCLEVTQRLLRIHAIRRAAPPRVRTYYAMAYNPWGEAPHTYDHSFAKTYLDMTNQVQVGAEFWDYLGGPGTYHEILEVYQEVGREKGPDMLDRLALGY